MSNVYLRKQNSWLNFVKGSIPELYNYIHIHINFYMAWHREDIFVLLLWYYSQTDVRFNVIEQFEYRKFNFLQIVLFSTVLHLSSQLTSCTSTYNYKGKLQSLIHKNSRRNLLNYGFVDVNKHQPIPTDTANIFRFSSSFQ